MNRPAVALLALGLGSCTFFDSEADAGVPPVPFLSPVVTSDGLTLEELTRVDVRGTAHSAQLLLEEIRAFPDSERTAAVEAMRVLQVSCPFNRASVQLPMALHGVVSRTRPEDLDELIQRDWAYLRDGLEAHVAALEALGADLPSPIQGQFLFRRLPPGAALTRAELAASADPVGDTTLLLEAIRQIVVQYDARTEEEIRFHTTTMQGITSHDWPLPLHVVGWRDALARMEPFMVDPERQREVRQMIEAIDLYMLQSC